MSTTRTAAATRAAHPPEASSTHGRRPDPLYRPLTPPAVGFVALTTRLRVIGAEHVPRAGPVLLAANHVSHRDPLVIAVVLYRCGRRVRFLAVSDVFEGPVPGFLLRYTGMIPVVRGAGPEAMVADARPTLAAGEAVLVYPEGTIPRPGERLPGKPGAGLLALEAGVPVLPLATYGLGTEERLRVRRRVAVVIGPPVDLTAWDGRRDRDAQAQASAEILAAVRGLEGIARHEVAASRHRAPCRSAGVSVPPAPGTR